MNSREGFALPAAIFALVIVGVLVTGGFFMAQQESRIGVATKNATEALYVAERGAAQVMSDWRAGDWFDQADWYTDTIQGNTDEGEWEVVATKMSPTTYFVNSRGTITEGGTVFAGATRRVGVTVRVIPAPLEPPAALTTQGDVTVSGGAEIRGEDTTPDGWDSVCNTDPNGKPGVMTTPGSTVDVGNNADVSGQPDSVETNDEIADSTFTQFGDLTWNELVAMADKHVPSGTVNGLAPSTNADGSCDTSDTYNWGDPESTTSACSDYFPMIYINGTATFQSSSVGQGILLVDGDVDLRGDFLFNGIIISQGNFETQGSGKRINGGVMAKNANLDSQRITGSSIVHNSTCAAQRAIMNNDALARPKALASRSWVDLTGVSYTY